MSIDEALRELMSERSAGRAVAPGHLAQIHRRLARRRARKRGLAAAATVTALAALTGAAVAWTRQEPVDGRGAVPATREPGTPSVSVPPLALPGHDRGQSLVEMKAEPLTPGHGEFSLDFTPRRWNFSISMDCVTAGPTDHQLEILINDARIPLVVMTCGRTPSGSGGLPEQPPGDDEQRGWWQNVHRMVGASTQVRLDEPVTITVRVGVTHAEKNSFTGTTIIRSGEFVARAGQAVVGVYQPG